MTGASKLLLSKSDKTLNRGVSVNSQIPACHPFSLSRFASGLRRRPVTHHVFQAGYVITSQVHVHASKIVAPTPVGCASKFVHLNFWLGEMLTWPNMAILIRFFRNYVVLKW